MVSIDCPHCGEPTDTFPDPDGGGRQEYIEDCAVCCRPIRFIVTYSDADGDPAIEIREV
jgi:hypothetical protein